MNPFLFVGRHIHIWMAQQLRLLDGATIAPVAGLSAARVRVRSQPADPQEAEEELHPLPLLPSGQDDDY